MRTAEFGVSCTFDDRIARDSEMVVKAKRLMLASLLRTPKIVAGSVSFEGPVRDSMHHNWSMYVTAVAEVSLWFQIRSSITRRYKAWRYPPTWSDDACR